MIRSCVQLKAGLQLFGDLIINNPTNIPMSAHAVRILRHNLIHVLTRQVIAVHLSAADLLLTIDRLGLIFVSGLPRLLAHFVVLDP